MSVNSSSSNETLLQPNISSIKPYIPSSMYCFLTRPGYLIYTTFFFIYILVLLPVCILVLCLCLQRWQKQQRSISTASSHSDIFTYHIVTMDLFDIFGYIILFCGIYLDRVTMLLLGYYLLLFCWFGQICFHLLTCVERYLAVVHPITYLSLRGERGIRIRNISIGCVWLLSFGGMSTMSFEKVSVVFNFCVLIFSLIIISFCSLSVLCVLIHPGPGEQEGGRKRVDQSKQRAFNTITAILGVLVLNFLFYLVFTVIYSVTEKVECVLMASEIWFRLFSSLVSPLLFLHRAGKLACCENTTNEDKD